MKKLLNFCGDSITFGLTHCTAEETYVAELARLLAAEYPDHTVTRVDGFRPSGVLRVEEYTEISVAKGAAGAITLVRNGVGGETVARALERFDQLAQFEADAVFMMYGVNDSCLGKPEKYVDPQTFGAQYRRLLDRLRQAVPEARLILMTPTVLNESLADYADAVRRLAAEQDLCLIDMNAFWAENAQPDWLREGDPCHPTPTAARAMANYIFSIIKTAL